MASIYSALRAKLRELESELNEAFSLPADSKSRESVSENVKQKILFIRKILSDEDVSHPSKPHRLQHIAKKLAKLESDYLVWEGFRTVSNEAFERDSSSCSCTESCFNDDAESPSSVEEGFDDPGKFSQRVYGGPVDEKPEVLFERFAADKAIVESDGGLVRRKGWVEKEEEMRSVGLQRDEVKREERRRESGFGKLCGAMAGGVVIGMGMMGFLMVKFSSCFSDVPVDQTSFGIPT